MVKKKQPYVSPEIQVTRVELESSICNGSVDMEAKSPGISTTAQEVNTDFAYNNNFAKDEIKWDSAPSGIN